jgi:uncharacterized SAM-binding protein YcdF (DUF218 family)
MNGPGPHSPAPDVRDSPRHWRAHPFLRFAALVAVCLVIYLGTIALQIARESRQQQLHAADAIVVFGAAEYAGRPSPVLRARLDHAYELFERQLAPVIITTGGAGEDPTFSEGGVGRDYLVKRGVPERNVIAETQGSDTAQSAQRVAVIMHVNGMHSALAVSDEYHVFRIRKLLEHEGIAVYEAPRPNSRPAGAHRRFVAVLREATSYLIWKLGVS